MTYITPAHISLAKVSHMAVLNQPGAGEVQSYHVLVEKEKKEKGMKEYMCEPPQLPQPCIPQLTHLPVTWLCLLAARTPLNDSQTSLPTWAPQSSSHILKEMIGNSASNLTS